ncbi:MAG: hypothetical protein DMF91_10350 [Acidobacteria bacterium]|nr:MAG: hypothetical protein DMF91_10350 [Acidobacteriota bacterium]
MRSGIARPTFDDVKLILQLYEMRREPRLREARQWFTASCKPKTIQDMTALCPPGSEQHASFRMVTTYWEMVASFLVSGVLNEALFYQSGRELLFVWERVRDIVPALRDQYKHPLELANLERAAEAYIEWWNAHAPGAYEAFSRRVRG